MAIDHTIFVVILIIEVWKTDDLNFEMMRTFFNFFNVYQSQLIFQYYLQMWQYRLSAARSIQEHPSAGLFILFAD